MREEMTTLGESCQFFNGKAHEKDIDKEGQFVVVNSKLISSDGEVKKFIAKQMFPLVEDDIVMVMSDVPNGKALAKCYVIEENDKYSLNQRICAIRTTEFSIRFLYYQLNRHPYLLAFNNGENQTNLRKGDILNCPLWKPTLDIQEQIVKILDEALDQIEQAQFNIEKNIENAKELFQSKLNEIFSQAARPSGGKGEGDAQSLSKGWEEKSLGEVSKIMYGYTSKIVENGNVQYVRITDIQDGNINWGTVPFVNISEDQKPKYSLSQGDIVFARTGATTGKSYLMISPPNTVFASYLIRVQCDNEILEPSFLYLFFQSGIYWRNVKAGISGSAQGGFNASKLGKMIIHFPIDKEKQLEFVRVINEFKSFTEKLLFHYHQKLDNLEDLKKSILQKAFSGALTVSNHD